MLRVPENKMSKSLVWCGRVQKFQKSMLHGSNMDLWNVGILPQHTTRSHAA